MITFIIPCKGRLEHLKKTLEFVMAQKNDVEVIVVDYDCPDNAGNWVEQAFPSVKVVRSDQQTIFNASKARNLGLKAATSEFVCFLDADICIPSDFSK